MKKNISFQIYLTSLDQVIIILDNLNQIKTGKKKKCLLHD